jgi:cysteine desulfurase/selenocysteine lyase
MFGDTIRQEFPVLARCVGEPARPLVYLDSAATCLMPTSVIEAITTYECMSRSNIHRGIHVLAEESTDRYETGREELAAFLGVSPATLILTHGTTEAINIVAHGWMPLYRSGASVLIAESNHHANIVPWQMIRSRHDTDIRILPLSVDGLLDRRAFREAVEKGVTLVALTQVSNVLGFVEPIQELVEEAHAAGATVLLDCAQSFGHMPLDLQQLGVDFAAASIHKAYGPFGVGFLWCHPKVFENLRPLVGGGGMVGRVSNTGFTCAEGVAAFEGGTPAISSVAGMREALRFLRRFDMDDLAGHMASLADTAALRLKEIEGITLLGRADTPRASLLSFAFANMHAHDVASAFDRRGIAVRAGHHCAMPLHDALGIPASVRASFAAYSTHEDVNALVDAARTISEERSDARVYRNRR